MAEGKWLTALEARTPVNEAARTALTVRLGAVRRYLPLAIDPSNVDVEAVHQLRVSTRRAAMVVRIFEDLLPGKKVRQVRRSLRRFRHAAGEARDWDVFILTLADSSTAKQKGSQSATDFLFGYALCRRMEAQELLIESASEAAKGFEEMCEDLPGSVKDGSGLHQSLAELGAEVLPPMAAELDEATRAGPTSPADLHRIRIAGKRLRYAMELFAGCYPSPFKEQLYPSVEAIQTILGSVQDGHVAIERLGVLAEQLQRLPSATARRVKPGLSARTREIQTRLRRDRQAFDNWVKKWNRERAKEPFVAFLKVDVPNGRPVTDSRPEHGKARPRATR